MERWPARRWAAAVLGTIGTAVLVGLPTEMVANPWFHRMTPVRWWDRPVWLLTAVLAGLLLATFVATPMSDERTARRGGIGGVLAFFAVGCPVCNKLVVLALGTAGAHTWFEPAQPFLGVGSVVLLVWALRSRLRGERGVCRARRARPPDGRRGGLTAPSAARCGAHHRALRTPSARARLRSVGPTVHTPWLCAT